MYFDEDSWQIVLSEEYDTAAKSWRAGEAHVVNLYEVPVPGRQWEINYDLKWTLLPTGWIMTTTSATLPEIPRRRTSQLPQLDAKPNADLTHRLIEKRASHEALFFHRLITAISTQQRIQASHVCGRIFRDLRRPTGPDPAELAPDHQSAVLLRQSAPADVQVDLEDGFGIRHFCPAASMIRRI